MDNSTIEEEFEPKQYFEELKSRLTDVQLSELESQLDAVSEQLLTAKRLGQKNMLHKLSFVYQTIVREKTLLVNDIKTYVYKEDIVKFIESVKPKNSVKIIELERFPRVIPDENAAKILKYKDLFDEVCIVFTDFTDESYESEADKKVINRNRDPIAFGYFKNAKANLRHDRFYFITDWEDEYCDLTLTKLVEELGKLGVKKPLKDIHEDASKYINDMVNEALAEAEEIATTPRRTSFNEIEVRPANFLDRLFNLFSNK